MRTPEDMLGQIDCLMVDHRDGKYHLSAAMPFLRAGIPCFIDKPFSTSVAEAKRFLALRSTLGVPVVTFSAVAMQSCIPMMREQLDGLGSLRVAHLTGSGNWRGKWGGIFFYGIHLTELMVTLFGPKVKSVDASINGTRCTIICQYPNDFTVTLTLNPDGPYTWTVNAIGAQDNFFAPVPMDANSYLPGVRCFTNMFNTGVEPFSDARMLAPIAVLEAAKQALTRKIRVRLPELCVKTAV